MRQTLFHIPHAFLGLPVFGLVSWGSLVLVVIAVLAILSAGSAENRQAIFKNNGFVWGAMLLLNAFLLPSIETRIEDWPVGLPIRGYGVLLMLGVLSGAWVALRRSKARGISTESFFSLATWTVVAGILGARLFYVVQYWDEMEGETLPAKLVSVLQITEGAWWSTEASSPVLPPWSFGLGRIGYRFFSWPMRSHLHFSWGWLSEGSAAC